jgi:lysozyme family protein
MDYAVNSGISRASKALQSVCGIANGDGIIGPASLNAIWTTVKNDGERSVVDAVTEQRREFIRNLSIYETFGKGWERRITETHEKAVGLIDG